MPAKMLAEMGQKQPKMTENSVKKYNIENIKGWSAI